MDEQIIVGLQSMVWHKIIQPKKRVGLRESKVPFSDRN